jgi:hypothetical protein
MFSFARPSRFLLSSPPGLTRRSMLKCASQWIAGSSPAMTIVEGRFDDGTFV